MQYQEAFNSANHLLMHYLNGLERIEISMATNANLGDRFNNLTSIQMQLADWLLELHRRMVHQKMHINCEGIRTVLQSPKREIEAIHQKVYLSTMMHKFIAVLDHVLGLFNKAIGHENAKRDGQMRQDDLGDEMQETLQHPRYKKKRGSRPHRHARPHYPQYLETSMELD